MRLRTVLIPVAAAWFAGLSYLANASGTYVIVPDPQVDLGVYASDPWCGNELAAILETAGFRNENHREAWAIAMRESRGIATTISETEDFGLFQFNKATWSDQPWWNEERLLDPLYNARVAYIVSGGGTTWWPWGLSGHGTPQTGAYGAWTPDQIETAILTPYRAFYGHYLKEVLTCQSDNHQ